MNIVNLDTKKSTRCEHNITKQICKICNPKAYCEHNVLKYNCKNCGGLNICIHQKRKIECKECKGSAICEHNKQKRYCYDCKGSSVCEHKKRKSECKECNGSRICEHKKRKSQCIDCEGSYICVHKKLKSHCKECGGSSLCKSEWCEKQGNPKYEKYCLFCYINLYPDNKIVKNFKTKERDVVDRIQKIFPNFTWVHDKKIQDGCSRKRPDLLLDLGSHLIIVEIDENSHSNYDCSCENKRLMELSKDVGFRNIVFIRFNPDDYIDNDGNKIKSCWKINKTSGVLVIDPKKAIEWERRLNVLIEQIKYWVNNQSEKMIEIVQLFY